MFTYKKLTSIGKNPKVKAREIIKFLMYKLQVVLVPPSARDSLVPLSYPANQPDSSQFMNDGNGSNILPKSMINGTGDMSMQFSNNNTMTIGSIIRPNYTNQAKTKKFLHFTKPTNSLLALSDEVLAKCEKMYPNLNEDLEILTLQDINGCDLDPDFTVKDIFNIDNVVMVLIKNELDVSSAGSTSIYRNFKRQKLNNGGAQQLKTSPRTQSTGALKIEKKRPSTSSGIRNPTTNGNSTLRISTPLANQIYPSPIMKMTNNSDDERDDVRERSFLPPPSQPQSPPIRISSGINQSKRIRSTIVEEDTVSRSGTVDPDKSKQQVMLPGTPANYTMTPNRVTLTGQRVLSENYNTNGNNNGLIFVSSTQGPNKSQQGQQPTLSTPRITSGMLRIPEPRIAEIERELHEGPSSPASALPAKSDRIPMKKPYLETMEQDDSDRESTSDNEVTPIPIEEEKSNDIFNTSKFGKISQKPDKVVIQRKSSLESKVGNKRVGSLAEQFPDDDMKRISSFSDEDEEEEYAKNQNINLLPNIGEKNEKNEKNEKAITTLNKNEKNQNFTITSNENKISRLTKSTLAEDEGEFSTTEKEDLLKMVDTFLPGSPSKKSNGDKVLGSTKGEPNQEAKVENKTKKPTLKEIVRDSKVPDKLLNKTKTPKGKVSDTNQQVIEKGVSQKRLNAEPAEKRLNKKINVNKIVNVTKSTKTAKNDQINSSNLSEDDETSEESSTDDESRMERDVRILKQPVSSKEKSSKNLHAVKQMEVPKGSQNSVNKMLPEDAAQMIVQKKKNENEEVSSTSDSDSDSDSERLIKIGNKTHMNKPNSVIKNQISKKPVKKTTFVLPASDVYSKSNKPKNKEFQTPEFIQDDSDSSENTSSDSESEDDATDTSKVEQQNNKSKYREIAKPFESNEYRMIREILNGNNVPNDSTIKDTQKPASQPKPTNESNNSKTKKSASKSKNISSKPLPEVPDHDKKNENENSSPTKKIKESNNLVGESKNISDNKKFPIVQHVERENNDDKQREKESKVAKDKKSTSTILLKKESINTGTNDARSAETQSVPIKEKNSTLEQRKEKIKNMKTSTESPKGKKKQSNSLVPPRTTTKPNEPSLEEALKASNNSSDSSNESNSSGSYSSSMIESSSDDSSDSSSSDEGDSSSSKVSRRLVVATPKGELSFIPKKPSQTDFSDLENMPQSTQPQQKSPPKLAKQPPKQTSDAAHKSESNVVVSKPVNDIKEASTTIKPSLSSLSDLVSRGIPDVKENKANKSNSKPTLDKTAQEPTSGSDDSGESSESSSSDSDSSSSDSDESSSSENEQKSFISAKSASAALKKKSKKVRGGFASLIKDSKKK